MQIAANNSSRALLLPLLATLRSREREKVVADRMRVVRGKQIKNEERAGVRRQNKRTRIDAANFSPSPQRLGRVALLPCAQRHIRVSRAHIPLNRHRRKQLPSAIQTIGDYIQAKRYEKGLHPYQVADKMGIAASLISAWERGTQSPDEKQLQMLSTLLSFDSGVDLPKPHR
jgi:ribosome-binding protein aMBF1 (putative translation factor)